jgi:putative acetyltransferase
MCTYATISTMPTISRLHPSQAAEVKRMLHSVAHEIFKDGETLEESIRIYQETWPLKDVDTAEETYFNNGGTFLVMTDDDGRVIGTGALKQIEEGDLREGVCEIKRLWFLPEYQGMGLGYKMMMTLLDTAREMGYRIARLETSPDYQQRAYAFYKRLGFYDIPAYGDESDDIGMEMRLD